MSISEYSVGDYGKNSERFILSQIGLLLTHRDRNFLLASEFYRSIQFRSAATEIHACITFALF